MTEKAYFINSLPNDKVPALSESKSNAFDKSKMAETAEFVNDI